MLQAPANRVERARELTKATGVPGKYQVLFKEYVFDVDYAERLVHERLDQFRQQPNREFFKVPLEPAIRTVLTTCQAVNREADLASVSNIRRMRLKLNGSHDAERLRK